MSITHDFVRREDRGATIKETEVIVEHDIYKQKSSKNTRKCSKLNNFDSILTESDAEVHRNEGVDTEEWYLPSK